MKARRKFDAWQVEIRPVGARISESVESGEKLSKRKTILSDGEEKQQMNKASFNSLKI